MNHPLLLLLGLILAFLVCLSGLALSYIRFKHYAGNGDMNRRSTFLNPLYLIYILFAVILALIIGIFTLVFNGHT